MKKMLFVILCITGISSTAHAVSCVFSTNNALTSAQVLAQSNNATEYQNCATISAGSVATSSTPQWYVYSCATCKSGTQATSAEGRVPSNQQLIYCTVCTACENSGSCTPATEVCSSTTGVCRTTKQNTSSNQCSNYCRSQAPTYECATGWYRTENWNSIPVGTKYCLAEGKGGTDYNCTDATGINMEACRKCSALTNNDKATSDKGDNGAITKCYLPAKTDCSDTSGKCELDSKCYYTN